MAGDDEEQPPPPNPNPNPTRRTSRRRRSNDSDLIPTSTTATATATTTDPSSETTTGNSPRGRDSHNNSSHHHHHHRSSKTKAVEVSAHTTATTSEAKQQRRSRSQGEKEERRNRRERQKARQAAAAAAAAERVGGGGGQLDADADGNEPQHSPNTHLEDEEEEEEEEEEEKNNDDDEDDEIYAVIRTTEADREKMRKVSKLGMMDPVDVIREQQLKMLQEQQRRKQQQQHHEGATDGKQRPSSRTAKNRRQQYSTTAPFKPPSQLQITTEDDIEEGEGEVSPQPLPPTSSRTMNTTEGGGITSSSSSSRPRIRRNKSSGSGDHPFQPPSMLFVKDYSEDDHLDVVQPAPPTSSRTMNTTEGNMSSTTTSSSSRARGIRRNKSSGSGNHPFQPPPSTLGFMKTGSNHSIDLEEPTKPTSSKSHNNSRRRSSMGRNKSSSSQDSFAFQPPSTLEGKDVKKPIIRRNKSSGSANFIPPSTLFVPPDAAVTMRQQNEYDEYDDDDDNDNWEEEPAKPVSNRSNALVSSKSKSTNKRDTSSKKKTRSRSLDDENLLCGFDDFEMPEQLVFDTPMQQQQTGGGGGGAPPPDQGGTSSTGNSLLRKVIEPTSESKQLMRQVSALGLEDPVFGNIHEETKPNHPSNIFEDMDYDDVPDDMKDILSIVSDRTDPMYWMNESACGVAMQALPPPTKRELFHGTTGKGRSKSSNSLSADKPPHEGSTAHSNRPSFDGGGAFVPPAVRAFAAEIESPPGAPQQTPPPKPNQQSRGSSPKRNSEKSKRSSKASSSSSSKPQSTAEGTKPAQSGRPDLRGYVPPTGSFRIKKVPETEKRGTLRPTHSAENSGLLIDRPPTTVGGELTITDIAPNKSGNKHKFRHSNGNLHNSLNFNLGGGGSGDDWMNTKFNDSFSKDSSTSGDRKSNTRSTTSKSKSDRRLSSPNDVYIPPPPPPVRGASGAQAAGAVSHEDSRLLPSIDGIFTSNTAKQHKQMQPSSQPAYEKSASKKKLPPSDPARTKMQKNASTRSWDSDNDGQQAWASAVFSTTNDHSTLSSDSPSQNAIHTKHNQNAKAAAAVGASSSTKNSTKSRRRRTEKSKPSSPDGDKGSPEGEGGVLTESTSPDNWFAETAAPILS